MTGTPAIEHTAPPTPAEADTVALSPVPGEPGRARGRTEIADRVVAKIVARAIAEVPGAEPEYRWRPTPDRSGHWSTTGRPHVSTTIDDHLVSVRIRMSVRWPQPVRAVAAAVRSRIRQRVAELTGLDVRDVDVHVTGLTTGTEQMRRVS